MKQQTFAEAVAAYIETERLKKATKPKRIAGGCIVYDFGAHRAKRLSENLMPLARYLGCDNLPPSAA